MRRAPVLRLRSTAALVPSLLLAAACAETPTAPSTDRPLASAPDLSVVTPFLLPPGVDWGLYFQSFNQNRTLNARVIHYPSGRHWEWFLCDSWRPQWRASGDRRHALRELHSKRARLR
jgi:hypothetical protein